MLNLEVESIQEPPSRQRVVTFGRIVLVVGGVVAIVGLTQLPSRSGLASSTSSRSSGGSTTAGSAALQRGLPGGDKDAHGCLASAGYQYCPSLDTCGRAWQDECPRGYEYALHCSPNRLAYPRAWGAPPLAQTKDLKPLPAHAGRGSSTLAQWIQMHLNADVGTEDQDFEATYYSGNGQAFPQSWGAPPESQTRDLVTLPGSFGEGSSTLRTWIQDKMDADRVQQPETAAPHYSPANREYPALWEAPPAVKDGDDIQELPCNGGEGSSRLSDWIQGHIDDDAECGTSYEEPDGSCFFGKPQDLALV